MRMGQGVRTGLGHGGITCVLQTQFSSFLLNLPIHILCTNVEYLCDSVEEFLIIFSLYIHCMLWLFIQLFTFVL